MKSRNTHALKTLAILLAALTYAGAVTYGEIQFLQVMGKAFPDDGIMRALAMAGAVMCGVSALVLPLALHWWFTPGLQFIWGIIFWVLDIVALSFNAILAYQLALAHVDPLMQTWLMLSPATPMLAVVGWGLAFLFDPSHRERHAIAEMQADQIDTYAEQMRLAARSDEVYQEILHAARIQAREFAQSLHGQRVTASAYVVREDDAPPKRVERDDDAKPKTARVSARAATTQAEPVAVSARRNGNGNDVPLP